MRRQPAHLVLHVDALRGPLLGFRAWDDHDLWVVDGRAGDAVAVVDLAPEAPRPEAVASGPAVLVLRRDTAFEAFGLDEQGRPQAPIPLTLRPAEVDVFDRVRGLLETDVLRDATVAVLGVGSGGSFVARELAKAGVGRFVLIDHDRLEAGNVCRHECGLGDLGRLKVHAVRDLLLDRNPTARVDVLAARITGRNLDLVAAALEQADLLICATDNRESRLLANRLAIRSGKTAIMGAVFRRAYGGQVIRIAPGLSPCYQCFVDALPEIVRDQEVASEDAAAAIAYSDRPVAIEPGLSADLLPVALQVVKLAIVELLGTRPTTLASLREDLVAPLYLWLNRREAGTDYAKLPPLEHRVDAMTILRWYGVWLDRNPACPACGDFEGHLLGRAGLQDAPLDTDLFAPRKA